MDKPPECLSPEGEVSIGETFNLNKLFAMSSDSARFVPGDAPNARVGCTSSSTTSGRVRFGTRTPNVEYSPKCVSRLGETLPVSRPDDPGASLLVSPFMFLPLSPPPVLRSSTPESHDMRALPPLSSIVAPTRPNNKGTRARGADSCETTTISAVVV